MSDKTATTSKAKEADATPASDDTEKGTTGQQPDSATIKAKPLKKISTATITAPDGSKIKDWYAANRFKGAEFEKYFAEGGDPIHIARIWGKVIKTSTGSNNYGEFVRFNGKFYCICGLTGTYYTAGQCLLPKWLENEVDTAFSEEGDIVYFGYDIFLIAAPDKSLGYEYTAENLTQPKTDMSFLTDTFAEIPANPTVIKLEDYREKTS